MIFQSLLAFSLFTYLHFLLYLKSFLCSIYMENLVKKLEEQIAFLQHEISQMSGELYSQQKEIKVLKKEIADFKKSFSDLENEIGSNTIKDDKKPPHY